MTAAPVAEAVLVRRAALRLGLQAAVFASVIVVLLSAAAIAVVLHSQRTAATTLLDAAVSRADDVGDPPAGAWLAIRGTDGTDITAGMPAGLPDTAAIARVAGGGPAESGEIRLHGEDYLIDTLRQPGGATVQGVLDLAANHTARDQLVAVLLLFGGVGLLLAALAGTLLGHRALRPLAAAIALQRRFVADAGHELRTPVTLLSTRAQLLRRRLRSDAGTPGAEAVVSDLDGIVADSARLGAILEDLLLAADPIAERPRQSVDLTGLVRSVLDAAGATAATRGVTLTGPEDHAPPVYVTGSPVALRRALTALVDNAVRHATQAVTLSVHAGDEQVLLDVTDDGPGIAPDVAPHLFERFVTGRPGPAEGGRRYGLGLALVSEIAAAHGGRVEVVGRDEPGAALRIHLPAAPRNL